jgi:hypothetical protein
VPKLVSKVTGVHACQGTYRNLGGGAAKWKAWICCGYTYRLQERVPWSDCCSCASWRFSAGGHWSLLQTVVNLFLLLATLQFSYLAALLLSNTRRVASRDHIDAPYNQM